jgi:hypothetical protein
MFEDTLIQRLLAELSVFEGADFSKQSVRSSMYSATIITLVEMQDSHPMLDAKVTSEHDPDTKVNITWWWMDLANEKNDITITFNPLKVEKANDKPDLLAAYERAMSVL